MPVKWLECKVQYNPDNSPNKQYTCTFVDYHKRETTVKVGGDQVCVDYVGPPGAPYQCQGHVRVDLADYGNIKGIIIFPVRTSQGVSDAAVYMTALKFTPPPVVKTFCVLRKRK